MNGAINAQFASVQAFIYELSDCITLLLIVIKERLMFELLKGGGWHDFTLKGDIIRVKKLGIGYLLDTGDARFMSKPLFQKDYILQLFTRDLYSSLHDRVRCFKVKRAI